MTDPFIDVILCVRDRLFDSLSDRPRSDRHASRHL